MLRFVILERRSWPNPRELISGTAQSVWRANHSGWLFSRSTCHSSHCRCSGLVRFEGITGWRSYGKYSFCLLCLALSFCVCVCVSHRQWKGDNVTVSACLNVSSSLCHKEHCLLIFHGLSICLCMYVCKCLAWAVMKKRKLCSHPRNVWLGHFLTSL